MLDKEQIKHIANLARLELDENKIDEYSHQLSSVLEYIDQLQEVDTGDVEPTAQVTGLQNAWREDEVKKWDEAERDMALNQAPDMDERQVKVKKIL